ncbi:MAG: heme exporter protein D [Gammaproteobacteria bacterium]|jgi:heme exporter protein D
MNELSDFLHMGGYGSYVWGSYGVVAIVLVGNLVAISVRRRTVVRAIAQRERVELRRAANVAKYDVSVPAPDMLRASASAGHQNTLEQAR